MPRIRSQSAGSSQYGERAETHIQHGGHMDFGAQFFHRPGKGRIDLAPGLGKNFLHLLEQRHGDVFKQTAGLGAVAAFHGGFEPYSGIMQGQMDGPELLKKRLQRGQFPLQPRFAGTVEPAAECALMPVQRGVQGGLAVVEQIRLHAGRHCKWATSAARSMVSCRGRLKMSASPPISRNSRILSSMKARTTSMPSRKMATSFFFMEMSLKRMTPSRVSPSRRRQRINGASLFRGGSVVGSRARSDGQRQAHARTPAELCHYCRCMTRESLP